MAAAERLPEERRVALEHVAELELVCLVLFKSGVSQRPANVLAVDLAVGFDDHVDLVLGEAVFGALHEIGVHRHLIAAVRLVCLKILLKSNYLRLRSNCTF